MEETHFNFVNNFNKQLALVSNYGTLKKQLTKDKWRINEHLEKHIANIFNQFNNHSISIINALEEDNYALSMGPDDFVPSFFKSEITKRDFTQSQQTYNLFCKFFAIDEMLGHHSFNDLAGIERFKNADTINLIIPIDVFVSAKLLDTYVTIYALHEKAVFNNDFSSTFSLKKLVSEKKVHIFILDNRRSNLLGNPETRCLFDCGWFDYPNILPNSELLYQTVRNSFMNDTYDSNGINFPFTPLLNHFFPLEIDFLLQGLNFENGNAQAPKKVNKPWKSIKKLWIQESLKPLDNEAHVLLLQKILN